MRKTSNKVTSLMRIKTSPLVIKYSFMPIVFNEVVWQELIYHNTISVQRDLLTNLNTEEMGISETFYHESLDGELDELGQPLEHSISTSLNKSTPTLKSFFLTQMIDIPLCFNRSKSLYSAGVSNPSQRFINLLMRHGKKTYISKLYTLSLLNLSENMNTEFKLASKTWTWQFIYTLFIQPKTLLNYKNLQNLTIKRKLINTNLNDVYSQLYTDRHFIIRDNNLLYDLFYNELDQYQPLFGFYVKKVDKLRRKHSRGKTGRYEIIWKYVPVYKRLITVLHWITKDIKFQKLKTLDKRMQRSLELLVFNKTAHLVYRIRQFVHKFVFENHKKTLLKTLRSVS